MNRIELKAKKREETGKKSAKAIRNAGGVPIILYGHGIQPLSVEVSKRDLQQVLHTKAGGNVVINLAVEGVKLKESTCRIKEIQYNPVTDEITHVDLTVISMTEKIAVKIPVVMKNAEVALGVKENGILDLVHHEIEIECLPTQIPEKIEVDVKELNIGESIHVRDLNLPSGVTCLIEVEEAVIALHPPRVEEEPEPSEEAASEPEVIEKGKKEDDGEEVEASNVKEEKPAKEKE